uniref:Vitelline membrane outer layer protein 1 homolog n=1 Tax=Leptobrachium leishanense TaxID=445787 RepID=A0A8C5MBE6_9ANUR
MLLVAFSLLCLLQFEQSYASVITVYNGGPWGDWGTMEKCPAGTRAAAFSLKVEREQGNGDDTALNGISLYCVNTNFQVVKTITSSVGQWGDWKPVQWCPSGYLQAFCLRVEGSQGRGDDTAANNIKFKCSSGEIIEGNGLHWGNYGAWSDTCHQGINGLNIKLEKPQGDGDDTSVNDVQFNCV